MVALVVDVAVEEIVVVVVVVVGVAVELLVAVMVEDEVVPGAVSSL